AHQVAVAAAHADQSAVEPFGLAGPGGVARGGGLPGPLRLLGIVGLLGVLRVPGVAGSGAGDAVEGEVLRDADGPGVGGVEAEADRAAGGDRGVPGGVGGGDVGSGGAELGVPALAEPLPGGEGPPQGPAVDGAAEVGDGDVAG